MFSLWHQTLLKLLGCRCAVRLLLRLTLSFLQADVPSLAFSFRIRWNHDLNTHGVGWYRVIKESNSFGQCLWNFSVNPYNGQLLANFFTLLASWALLQPRGFPFLFFNRAVFSCPAHSTLRLWFRRLKHFSSCRVWFAFPRASDLFSPLRVGWPPTPQVFLGP